MRTGCCWARAVYDQPQPCDRHRPVDDSGNGPFDADPADGQLLLINVPPGTYTITETVPPLGYVLDADPTRVVTVTLGELTQVIGVQGMDNPGVTNESDFHNILIEDVVGSIAWEKRDADGVLLGGARFTISPDPRDGVGLLTILDNGPFDANPTYGQLLLINVRQGRYTITETVPPLGYVLDADPTRVVTVTLGDLRQVIGVQGMDNPGVTDESDFHNRRRNVIVIGMGKSPITPQFVRVIDEESGALLAQFAPTGTPSKAACESPQAILTAMASMRSLPLRGGALSRKFACMIRMAICSHRFCRTVRRLPAASRSRLLTLTATD